MTNALKWRIALVLVLVFFGGIATGVFLGARHARHVFFAVHSGHFGDRMREHLKRELKLTPEQFDKVGPVIDKMSGQLEAIRDDTTTRVAEAMSDSHREIAPLLSQEQREKLEELKRRHERILRWRGVHRPPGDSG